MAKKKKTKSTLKPIAAGGSAPEREAAVSKFWKKSKIFRKSLQQRKKGEPYVFFEGPPTANGTPHPGHVLTRVMKDVFPRYRTMRGYRVDRKAGWDTHGLPVEVEVERRMNLMGKAATQPVGGEAVVVGGRHPTVAQQFDGHTADGFAGAQVGGRDDESLVVVDRVDAERRVVPE